MIIESSIRGGAGELAGHLVKAENEFVQFVGSRGTCAIDLESLPIGMDELVDEASLTKVRKPLIHVSASPSMQEESLSTAQWDRVWAAYEKEFGLSRAAYVEVEHLKQGRVHRHRVYARNDGSDRAPDYSWNRPRQEKVARILEVELGHSLVAGGYSRRVMRELAREGRHDVVQAMEQAGLHVIDRPVRDRRLWEEQQRAGTQIDPAVVRWKIAQAVQAARDGREFEAYLLGAGLVLARGDRALVAVDEAGGTHELARAIAAEAKASGSRYSIRQARQQLGPALDGIDQRLLPTVQEATAEARLRADPEIALRAITRHHAQFTMECLETEISRRASDPELADTTKARLLGGDELICLGADVEGAVLYTTADIQRIEAAVVAGLGRLHEAQEHAVSAESRALALEAADQKLAEHGGLTHDQRQAVDHVLADDGLSLVVGIAGAGKSTMMAAARVAWEADGYEVIGAAPSAKAARALNDSGIEASTMHALQRRLAKDEQSFTDRTVLVVDEAGMADVRTTQALVDEVERAGAKLVLIGDPEQLQPVGPGAPYRQAVAEYGAARLDTVVRQRESWMREATGHLEQGRAEVALDAYRDHGMVIADQDRGVLIEALVDDWAAALDQGKSALLIARTNDEVAELNAAARERLRERGDLVGPEVTLTIARRASSLEVDQDALALDDKAFAVGDRLVFRRNAELSDPTVPGSSQVVANGLLGTVSEISEERVCVETDDRREVAWDPKAYRQFDHGCAVTVHGAQGTTVDRAQVLLSGRVDTNQTYVALTRHRDEIKIATVGDQASTQARMFDADLPAIGRSRDRERSADMEKG